MGTVTQRDASRHHPVANFTASESATVAFPALSQQVGPLDRDIIVFRAVRNAQLGLCQACPPWAAEHPAEIAIDHRTRFGRLARRGTCQASFSELVGYLAGEADELLVWVPSDLPTAGAALPPIGHGEGYHAGGAA